MVKRTPPTRPRRIAPRAKDSSAPHLAPARRLEPCAALVMVAPTASEVPTVQRVIEELPVDTVFLLLNPKLVDMQSARLELSPYGP